MSCFSDVDYLSFCRFRSEWFSPPFGAWDRLFLFLTCNPGTFKELLNMQRYTIMEVSDNCVTNRIQLTSHDAWLALTPIPTFQTRQILLLTTCGQISLVAINSCCMVDCGNIRIIRYCCMLEL